MIDRIKANKELYLVVLGMVVYTILNIAYDVFEVRGVWYIGNSFAFVCYSYALLLSIPHWITKLLLILCIGQFSDELIGVPLDVSLFEYLIPTIYYIHLIYKKWKTQ